MKFIIDYKLFEDYSSQLEADCEDILLPLIDSGIPVKVCHTPEKVGFSDSTKWETLLKVMIGKPSIHARPFTWEEPFPSSIDFRPKDWINQFDHLNSFLSSQGWNFYDLTGVLSTWNQKKTSILKGRMVQFMEIYFRKV